MLQPELIIAEAGGTAVGERCGSKQGKKGARQQPEIGDVKQLLALAYYHEGAENNRPAAYAKGKVGYGTL